MPGDGAADYYFGCNACGKCCNSAPRLLLPELFHHQSRFVGCLGVERAGSGFELFVHGFSFASADACPARAADGRCSLHAERKPSLCSVVPLDATQPDSAQAQVLATRRSEAAFWGSDCIRTQPTEGFRQLTKHLRLVDGDSAQLLARQRVELELERRYWGEATARLLVPELSRTPELLKPRGVLTLSLVPVLATLAQVSARCRARVMSFVRAQSLLQKEQLAAALARKNHADRAETARLRKLLLNNQRFELALAAAEAERSLYAPEFVSELEAWLAV